MPSRRHRPHSDGDSDFEDPGDDDFLSDVELDAEAAASCGEDELVHAFGSQDLIDPPGFVADNDSDSDFEPAPRSAPKLREAKPKPKPKKPPNVEHNEDSGYNSPPPLKTIPSARAKPARPATALPRKIATEVEIVVNGDDRQGNRSKQTEELCREVVYLDEDEPYEHIEQDDDDDDSDFADEPKPPARKRKSNSKASAQAKISRTTTRASSSLVAVTPAATTPVSAPDTIGRTPLRPLGGSNMRPGLGMSRPLGLGLGLSSGMRKTSLGSVGTTSASSQGSEGNESKPHAPSLVKPFKIPTFKKAPTGAISQHNHSLNRALGMRAGIKPVARPLHDPDTEGAMILWTPPEISAEAAIKQDEKDKRVHVVVDPTLSQILRPHQVDGVHFMYKCVTGEQVEDVFGCIMADEMGLGKTLQCITLLWTLLRQSPIPNKPTIEKAIIVCPSSLVRNWANELVKWLGKNAIHPLCADNKSSKEQSLKEIAQFVSSHGRAVIHPVLIISYESLRLYSPYLGQTPIGLMLCDEGHRLKNSNSQTFQALNALNIPRRVILSGTPIQNDLTEYFSLLNFACPGLLGTETEFRRNFELPILRGRDAYASEQERATSDVKLKELVGVASRVIIRRTQELLRKYLPTKQEHVVFCKLAPRQLEYYGEYLASPDVQRLLRGKDSQPLKAITHLKKLCNHPGLLDERATSGRGGGVDVDASGKLVVLERMLHKIKSTTKDKIVLISNYTQTLDLFERLCSSRAWGCLRLDGSMAVKKRQKLVDQFNDPEGGEFVFLLSSKAGGCGLNLIGANRLVLFDPDWNPASDQQALARVWRDGQGKTCYIYRFIATGTIEEKIFQRQCHKQLLSNCVVDEEQDVERHFSLENLRLLFSYNGETLCDTHDTFKCKRCVNHRQFKPPPRDQVSSRNAATDMSLWNHFSALELIKVPDSMIRECGKDVVSFIFHNEVST